MAQEIESYDDFDQSEYINDMDDSFADIYAPTGFVVGYDRDTGEEHLVRVSY